MSSVLNLFYTPSQFHLIPIVCTILALIACIHRFLFRIELIDRVLDRVFTGEPPIRASPSKSSN